MSHGGAAKDEIRVLHLLPLSLNVNHGLLLLLFVLVVDLDVSQPVASKPVMKHGSGTRQQKYMAVCKLHGIMDPPSKHDCHLCEARLVSHVCSI